MARVEQPNNPNFPATWDGDSNSLIVIYAVIGNEVHEWDESFKVTSMENAEAEVSEVIGYFNATLRRGDKPRKFVRIGKVSE